MLEIPYITASLLYSQNASSALPEQESPAFRQSGLITNFPSLYQIGQINE